MLVKVNTLIPNVMSAGMSRGFDSHFGPASQPINVNEFLRQANSADLSLLSRGEQLSNNQRDAVEAEVTARYSFPPPTVVALIATSA